MNSKNDEIPLDVQLEDLRQAVESFVIASATCSHDDKVRSYIHMLKVANYIDTYQEINMRTYPSDKEMPKRNARKHLRKEIFEENRTANTRARKARRLARKGNPQ